MTVYLLEVGNWCSDDQPVAMGVFHTPKRAKKWLKERGVVTGKWTKYLGGNGDEGRYWVCPEDNVVYYVTQFKVIDD